MYANNGAIDRKLLFEATFVTIEKCCDTNQKGDDTHALGQPIRGHDKSLAGLEKQTALHIMKRRFLLTTHFDFIALRRF